jgi:hypothetical protein
MRVVEVIESNEEEIDPSSPILTLIHNHHNNLHDSEEIQRLLGGNEVNVPRPPRYGTDSLVVFTLNENILLGLFVFPKALLDWKEKLIEWWWRCVASVFTLCMVLLLLTLPRVYAVKTPSSMLWELEVSLCAVFALHLFRYCRDHYLLLTFNTLGWLGGLKITLFDIGLPLLIITSFFLSIKSFLVSDTDRVERKNHLLRWLSACLLTFILQTLWCASRFVCISCSLCQSPRDLRTSLQKFRLSVCSLSTPQDSPAYASDDGTPQETACRKVSRVMWALGYIVLGFGLVSTTLLFITRTPHKSSVYNI